MQALIPPASVSTSTSKSPPLCPFARGMPWGEGLSICWALFSFAMQGHPGGQHRIILATYHDIPSVSAATNRAPPPNSARLTPFSSCPFCPPSHHPGPHGQSRPIAHFPFGTRTRTASRGNDDASTKRHPHTTPNAIGTIRIKLISSRGSAVQLGQGRK